MNNSILIGTTNPGKRREMAALIMAAGLKPVFRDDLPEIADAQWAKEQFGEQGWRPY